MFRLAKRGLLMLLAAGCLSAAAFIVAQAGLPERAAFTGSIFAAGTGYAPEIAAPAPLFTARTLDGGVFRLAALRGSPVVLNFWATWCGPCRFELPELQALYAALQPRGLRIVAVNLGERPEAARAWVEALDLTFDIVLDEQRATAARYHLRGQPSTFIISPDGVITAIFYGPASADALRAALAAHLTD